MTRPEPPTDEMCCGSGCDPCVWDRYYDEVEATLDTAAPVSQVRTVGGAVNPFDPPQNCVRVAQHEGAGTVVESVYGLTPLTVHTSPVEECGELAPIRTECKGADLCTAATLPLFCCNSDTHVTYLMRRLAYEERCVHVLPSVFSAGVDAPTYPHWIPQDKPFLVSDIFRYFTDITSKLSVRQNVLRVLGDHAADAEQKGALHRLASAAHVAEYRALFRDGHCNFVTLLERYPSCLPPLAKLLSVLPQLKARYFSNLAMRAGRADFLIRDHRSGGHTLASMRAGARCYVGGPLPGTAVHEGDALYELVKSRNPRRLLLVSAGSGVAPMLRIGQQLEGEGRELWLYHGCRVPADSGFTSSVQGIDRCVVAYSQESPKQYVRAKLEGDPEVAGFLTADTMVAVCGPEAMVVDTQDMLSSIGVEQWVPCSGALKCGFS